MKWVTLAAEQGDTNAQNKLVLMNNPRGNLPLIRLLYWVVVGVGVFLFWGYRRFSLYRTET